MEQVLPIQQTQSMVRGVGYSQIRRTKKYKITSVIENVGDVDDTVSLMLTYKAEISGGAIAANGDIIESNIALVAGNSVTKVNTVTTGTDVDTYAGLPFSVKSSTSGAKN